MGQENRKLVSLLHICSLYGLSPDQASGVLEGLVGEMRQACLLMEEARESRNWQQVRRIAHHQMPAFRMCNIAPMVAVCENLLGTETDESSLCRDAGLFLSMARAIGNEWNSHTDEQAS